MNNNLFVSWGLPGVELINCNDTDYRIWLPARLLQGSAPPKASDDSRSRNNRSERPAGKVEQRLWKLPLV